nr:centrosomal protein of 89 kDa-like isoform X3 [Dermacentor andersoni]
MMFSKTMLKGRKKQAHQVVSERDSLEIKNEEKEKECQRMLELLGQHNVDIDQLNKYLKNIQDQTEDEKHKVKHRREVEGNLQEEYEQQISHLHTKVEQKQQELESVHREKRWSND